jgi:hypothetical protein
MTNEKVSLEPWISHLPSYLAMSASAPLFEASDLTHLKTLLKKIKIRVEPRLPVGIEMLLQEERALDVSTCTVGAGAPGTAQGRSTKKLEPPLTVLTWQNSISKGKRILKNDGCRD